MHNPLGPFRALLELTSNIHFDKHLYYIDYYIDKFEKQIYRIEDIEGDFGILLFMIIRIHRMHNARGFFFKKNYLQCNHRSVQHIDGLKDINGIV